MASTRGYAKGRAKRQEILDAAVIIFSEVGFYNASLREIALRCNISHTGLLHHFKTKEELLSVILAQREDSIYEELGVDSPDGVTSLGKLYALALRAERTPIMSRSISILTTEATQTDHPAHAYFREYYANLRNFVDESLYQAAAEGDLNPQIIDLIPQVSASLIAAIDGMMLQQQIDIENVAPAKTIQRIFHFLLAPDISPEKAKLFELSSTEENSAETSTEKSE